MHNNPFLRHTGNAAVMEWVVLWSAYERIGWIRRHLLFRFTSWGYDFCRHLLLLVL